jgi:predicted alpha/beta superfamily hydrolase
MMPSQPRFLGSIVALLLPLLLSAGAEPVRVKLVVSVPPGTAGPVYIAGDLPVLGPWRPDALRLTPNPDGTHTAEFEAPADTTIEFKFTRGSWETVEKSETGAEIANRKLLVSAGMPAQAVAVARFADGAVASRASTVTGDLRLHERFESQALGNRRTIRVWLPPGYDTDTGRKYPVIYFHDGQNLFDNATSAFGTEWGLDEALTRLIQAGTVRPAIIVGIDNTPARIAELTPTAISGPNNTRAGGNGANYGKFLVTELKPFIDRTYRTLPDRANTSVAGSSLGGLISLYLIGEYPEVFSAAGVVSPALWWDGESLTRRVADPAAFPLPPGTRIYIDMGTAEGTSNLVGSSAQRSLNTTRNLRDTLTARGLKPVYVEIEGGQHNEAAWAKRAGEILKALISPPN